MKTKNILIVIGALLALSVAGFALYRLGLYRGSQPMTLAMNASAASPSTADKKILYWHDPMVPATKFDKPGKSPFMDMQLVAVYADEGATDTTGITINPRVRNPSSAVDRREDTPKAGTPKVNAAAQPPG